MSHDWIIDFRNLTLNDIPQVGGKNASLGEMIQSLSEQGVRVPGGFAITAEAYRHYMNSNGLTQSVSDQLSALDTHDLDALAETGEAIRKSIIHAKMPEDLRTEILTAYHAMQDELGSEISVALRSSATAEDLPGASFAGQQETYLNVQGDDHLIRTCQKVFASLFTNRAISYRVDKGFAHDDVALSIGVQLMVRSDIGSSGVMFTLDTESGFRDAVLITAAYGLGENVVQGAVTPDEFLVHKPTLEKGFAPIIKKQCGSKAIQMIYDTDDYGRSITKNIDTPVDQRSEFALNDDEVLELARYAIAIEKHYSAHHGKAMAMDIEWGKDGNTGELYILQARPETVHSEASQLTLKAYHFCEEIERDILVTGKSVGQKIATGRVKVIDSPDQINRVEQGDILVTDMTDPDWEPIMQIASAIVTNRGGRTCHAAIIARELGIPAIVGTATATADLNDEQRVTVSCAEGDVGYVYEGEHAFEVTETPMDTDVETQTKIMLNLANPEQAFDVSRYPASGVGLARMEFIINAHIQAHPLAILNGEHSLTPADYVERLAQGIGMIAAAFYPRPVILRLADFKSNEYASLEGGEKYEPTEENPMLGLRGASRYPHPDFRKAFELDCQAIRRVRESMGLGNLQLMVPFVRTVDEGQAVLDLLAEQGLQRSDDLHVYLMCEIPANALLADEFLAHFDGFSIGSNDLTQLTLGADRDSGLLQGYDERNPAVKALIKLAIEACHRNNKYVGICGQAPSDFPDFTQWLVEQGIDSLSLNPDSFIAMRERVADVEKAL